MKFTVKQDWNGEILTKILEARLKLPPAQPRQMLFVSIVDGMAGKSFYDMFMEAEKKVGPIGMPIKPVDWPITKTVDKVKKWSRQNRPAKVRVRKREVPAFLVMDRDMGMGTLSQAKPELRWTPQPPKFQHNFNLMLGYRY